MKCPSCGASIDRRTNEQNDKMWAMLTDIAHQVEWYGRRLSPENWKDIFTAGLRGYDVVAGLDGRSLVVLGLHTSKMGKREMSELIELMYAFGSERNVRWSEPCQEPSR